MGPQRTVLYANKCDYSLPRGNLISMRVYSSTFLLFLLLLVYCWQPRLRRSSAGATVGHVGKVYLFITVGSLKGNFSSSSSRSSACSPIPPLYVFCLMAKGVEVWPLELSIQLAGLAVGI